MTASAVGFGEALEFPYFEGSVSVDVGSAFVYPVTLDGVGYLLDDKDVKLSHRSVPLQRTSIDDRDSPGKATLNPEAFWRRRFESWHVGAGQTHFDADDSNPWRFNRSRGIDVWTRNQVSLLNDTDQKRASGNSNLFLAVAGSFLYATDGTALVRTADITPGSPTFTTITGGTAATFSSMASDGFNILLACGASGIDKTTRGAATKANHITGTVTQVAYGKGRWIASSGPALYDITTLVGPGGALPAALFTQPNTDFAWNCFAEGPSAFYAGGFSGDKSLIYRLTMKEDGTGLNQPVVAGFLPDGETLSSMQGYLGFVLIGTSKGVRVGIPADNGDLSIGAFIPTNTSVDCFEGQDRFVWFGWGNFENSSISGLGRIDLQTFSDPDALAPSYASDLMATTGGTNTVNVVTFQARRVFSVSALGIYGEEVGTLVATGEIDSGIFDYGLSDEKLSLYIDMTHVSLNGGSHSIYLSVDRGAFGFLATMTTDHDPIATGEARGREFEVRVRLARDGVSLGVGPVIRSWSLRVQPVPPITELIEAPLLIGPTMTRLDGLVDEIDSVNRAAHIVELCRSKNVVLYSEGDQSWSVIVTDYQRNVFETWAADDVPLGQNVTCLTQMKVVT